MKRLILLSSRTFPGAFNTTKTASVIYINFAIETHPRKNIGSMT